MFDRRLPDPTLVAYVSYRLDYGFLFGTAGLMTWEEWRARR